MCGTRLERMIDAHRPTTAGGTENPADSRLNEEM